MGWHKRAAGHSYSPLSGCMYIVGVYSRLILLNLVFFMRCAQCLKALKQGLPAPKHRCSKNYKGSSKGMEAKAVVQLVTKYYILMKNSFIRRIVSDDDSTMRAAMQHSKQAKIDTNEWDEKKRNWPAKLIIRVILTIMEY